MAVLRGIQEATIPKAAQWPSLTGEPHFTDPIEELAGQGGGCGDKQPPPPSDWLTGPQSDIQMDLTRAGRLWWV